MKKTPAKRRPGRKAPARKQAKPVQQLGTKDPWQSNIATGLANDIAAVKARVAALVQEVNARGDHRPIIQSFENRLSRLEAWMSDAVADRGHRGVGGIPDEWKQRIRNLEDSIIGDHLTDALAAQDRRLQELERREGERIDRQKKHETLLSRLHRRLNEHDDALAQRSGVSGAEGAAWSCRVCGRGMEGDLEELIAANWQVEARTRMVRVECPECGTNR